MSVLSKMRLLWEITALLGCLGALKKHLLVGKEKPWVALKLCGRKYWERSLLQETPTNRLEVVRRVNKVLSHGWRICFLFPLLLCELSIIPLAFTIQVCFPCSEISGSSPGVPCTAHPILFWLLFGNFFLCTWDEQSFCSYCFVWINLSLWS